MSTNKSAIESLRQATIAANSTKKADGYAEDLSGCESDAQQLLELIRQAAGEGLWEFDLAFHNRSDAYLNRIASIIKSELFDVFVVLDTGKKTVKASWYPNK